jgi:hypothetical protein
MTAVKFCAPAAGRGAVFLAGAGSKREIPAAAASAISAAHRVERKEQGEENMADGSEG